VLDDGSHQMRDLAATFQYLYPRVTPCGLYIVEDLHTSYWDEYGGGLQRRGTFIEFCKSMLDELNAEWTRGAMAPTQFTRSTLSMHFYDSMVVFGRWHREESVRQTHRVPPHATGPSGTIQTVANRPAPCKLN
jgi:hypothetical protein